MDFGRIEHIDQVDFSLPSDHKGLARVLGGNRAAVPQIHVGGVLWASDSFPGTIYPAKARPADYVKYYTRQFNTIELNATHYKIPTAETLKRWYSASSEGFKFCPKIHQSVSHADHLGDMVAFQIECNQAFGLLQEKLGTVFMQLPPQFSPGRLQELLFFLEAAALPGMAIELRHPAWFLNDGPLNTLCNYLYKKELGLVLTDTPGRRDVLHMRLTNKTAFVRFNGHNNFAGDKARIDAWVEKARTWLEMGLEEFYFFVHTPGQLFMPGLVSYFIDRLGKVCNIHLEPPVFQSREEDPPIFLNA
jgi:uncharacterized protein YecE (DUF72 family)